jgi:serine/threonine protein phosphatase PrpC
MTIENTQSVVTYASEQGKRNEQQDRFLVVQKNDLCVLAVFDGHGGSDAADFCCKELRKLLQQSNVKCLQTIFKHLSEKSKDFFEGTTASIVFIQDDRAFIGVLGDSPVIVSSSQGIHVSKEHHTSNKHEIKMAVKRGARIITLGSTQYIKDPVFSGGLNVTRAFGNRAYRSYISKIPDMYSIDGPYWILVCTDGFFCRRLMHRKKTIINMMQGNTSAEDLIEWARKTPSGLFDNTTVILWRKT